MHPACIKKFFGTTTLPAFDYTTEQLDQLALQIIQDQTSLTGIQPKLSLHLNEHEGNKRLTIVGLWGGYICKPQKTRVQEMGDELYERLKDKNPLFLGVLKGSFIFMADIVRACQLKSDIEFIAVSSYQNATTSSGVVQITRDLQQDITGRDIVVIEDILDSGNTLYFLKNYFMTKGASSVTVVTLLDKPARRTKPIAADLAGFEVPDEFVVGYGLDYAQKYRNMPYIGVLKPEVYSEN